MTKKKPAKEAAPSAEGEAPKPAKTVKQALPRKTPVRSNGTVPEGATVSAADFRNGAALDVESARHQAVKEAFEAVIVNGESTLNFDSKHGFELPFCDRYDACAKHLSGATVWFQRTFPSPADPIVTERIASIPTYLDMLAYVKRMWDGTVQHFHIQVKMGTQHPRCKTDERFGASAVRKIEYETEQRLAVIEAQRAAAVATANAAPASEASRYATTRGNDIERMLLEHVLGQRGIGTPSTATEEGGINKQLLDIALSGGGKGGLDPSTVNLLVKAAMRPQPAPAAAPDAGAADREITKMLLEAVLRKDAPAAAPAAGASGFWPPGVTVEPGTGRMAFHGLQIGILGQAPIPMQNETVDGYIERQEKAKLDRERLAKATGLVDPTAPAAKEEKFRAEKIGDGWYVPTDEEGNVDAEAYGRWLLLNAANAGKKSKELFAELKMMWDADKMRGEVDPKRRAHLDQVEREVAAKKKANDEEQRAIELAERRAAIARGETVDDEEEEGDDEEPESEREPVRGRPAPSDDDEGEVVVPGARTATNGAAAHS